MSRRYTSEEKDRALKCLATNDGDFYKTRDETGIPVESLRRWRKQQLEQRAQLDREHLAWLHHKLVESAVKLACSLEGAIDNAPLNQRASALGTVIDRYIKLADYLPQHDNREQVIRIEYLYPDGSIHDTPPWAAENSEHTPPVPGGDVRQTLRQNGNGQGAHYRNGAAWRTLLVAGPDSDDGDAGLAGPEGDFDDERAWYHD
jgi:transposase-like protein